MNYLPIFNSISVDECVMQQDHLSLPDTQKQRLAVQTILESGRIYPLTRQGNQLIVQDMWKVSW